jgi:hypothetical protein
MRRKVREARERGIGVNAYPEEMVNSIAMALSKRKRDNVEEDEEEAKEDSEDSHPTSKRQRTMD